MTWLQGNAIALKDMTYDEEPSASAMTFPYGLPCIHICHLPSTCIWNAQPYSQVPIRSPNIAALSRQAKLKPHGRQEFHSNNVEPHTSPCMAPLLAPHSTSTILIGLHMLAFTMHGLCSKSLSHLPRILQVMLMLKSVRIVMTMRKSAVMRSSAVRTQAGGDGIACGVEEVELLFFVSLLEVGRLGSVKGAGDRETSSDLERCRRGRIVTMASRRGVGTQYGLLAGFLEMV